MADDADHRCPYCGAIAANVQQEVDHMEAEHPEIIEQRMLDAGFRRMPDGRWVDTLSDQYD